MLVPVRTLVRVHTHFDAMSRLPVSHHYSPVLQLGDVNGLRQITLTVCRQQMEAIITASQIVVTNAFRLTVDSYELSAPARNTQARHFACARRNKLSYFARDSYLRQSAKLVYTLQGYNSHIPISIVPPEAERVNTHEY